MHDWKFFTKAVEHLNETALGLQRIIWDETGLKDARTQLGILEAFRNV